jgi:hypothetical protein
MDISDVEEHGVRFYDGHMTSRPYSLCQKKWVLTLAAIKAKKLQLEHAINGLLVSWTHMAIISPNSLWSILHGIYSARFGDPIVQHTFSIPILAQHKYSIFQSPI